MDTKTALMEGGVAGGFGAILGGLIRAGLGYLVGRDFDSEQHQNWATGTGAVLGGVFGAGIVSALTTVHVRSASLPPGQ